jgi:hypothetical protein
VTVHSRMGRPRRNPRRAYDENGREIPPVTVAASRASGLHTVAVFCEARGCHHDAVISLDGWSDALPVPDMALHLHCSKCGGRQIKIMINVKELYARAHGAWYQQ